MLRQLSLVVFISVLSIAMLSACTTQNAYTGEDQTSSATTGAIVGALGGAVLGAMTGNNDNVAIGAALGAGIGGTIGHSQDKQEAALRNKLKGTGVRIQRNGNDIKLIMPSDITFATNKFKVKPQFQPVLNSIVIVLKKFNNNYVRVAGYTDSTGSAKYNLGLSKRRAASVRNYLQAQGIASATPC